jgi:hypothetical protein
MTGVQKVWRGFNSETDKESTIKDECRVRTMLLQAKEFKDF